MSRTKGSESSEYGTTAKLLHWLVVALLVVQYALGWTMPDVRRGTVPDGLIAWHLAVGALIVVVVLFRLLWRLRYPVALLDDGSPAWQQLLAGLTHWLLYVVLALLLLLGWANASARGWTVAVLGVVPLPPLAAAGSRIGMEAGDIHSIVGWCLLALVGLHVAAALYHRIIRRDQVLQRMLPKL